jgi:GTP-binding protein
MTGNDTLPPFPLEWAFLLGVPSLKFLPPEGPPEIAFAGRSNVGKSSLINALVGRRNLARTSNMPGRTQELNFFAPVQRADAPPPLLMVDMPGYGYARAPKAKVDAWTRFVFDYLRGRASLCRVFLLIDARHGIKANDSEVMDLLDRAAVSYQIVLTKIDQIRAAELDAVLAAVAGQIRKRGAAHPEVLATSSAKGTGIDELREAVMRSVHGRMASERARD